MSDNGICPACGAMGIKCRLHESADDLLATLKYARRFVDEEDADTEYIDDVIARAEGKSE